MSAPQPTNFDDLPAADKRLVNEACERFEAALRAGEPARVADYLTPAPAPLRPILLAELLRLECEYRHRPADIGLPGRSVGPFVLAEELGRGGFGVVYRATDTRDGRSYAVKLPRAAALSDPLFRERFLREAEAAVRLSHPNIVKTHQVGADGPVCYLATEYVAGPTLATWLAGRVEPVSAREAAGLVAAVADAVHHAHERGVLHRDLKPSNVLLQPGADGLTPKVVDFGLARLVDRDAGATQAGVVVGTPAYMAPEQVTGRHPVSTRTDVYALGAILYELLTGRPPFEADVPLELLFAVAHAEPVGPRALRRGLPADLEAVCLRCLEKNPAGRYASAGELADDLRRFLAGLRTKARPPGPLRRSWKWARRHPALAVVVAAAVLAVVGSLVGLEAHARRLRSANAGLASALAERDASNRDLRRVAYASDVRRADALIDRGEVAEARRVLARWEPVGDEEDLRGWEWHYLLNRIGRHQLARWDAGTVYSLAFAPDGGALAGGGANKCVRLWDPVTGHELAPPMRHPAEVNTVAWAPGGGWLASACDDGGVRVWPRAGGPAREIGRHAGRAESVAVSPDGRTVASAGKDRTVALWDPGRMVPERHVCADWMEGPRSLAFRADGRSLIVGWGASHAQAVEAAERGRPGFVFRGHDSPVVAVRVAPTGNPVVTAGRLEVLVWDWDPAAAEARLRYRLPGNEHRVNDVAISPGGRWLAVAGDGGVRVWDLDGPRPCVQFCGHEGRVWAVAFHPAGRLLATAGADGTVRTWDLAAARAEEEPLVVPGAGNQVVLLPGPPRVAVLTNTEPAGVEVWEWERDGPVRVASGSGESLRRLAPTPDGRAVVTDDVRGRLARWEVGAAGGGIRPAGPGEMPRLTPTPLFAPDRRTYVATNLNYGLAVTRAGRVATVRGSDVHVWGPEIRPPEVLTGHRGGVTALALHPDGTTLAGASSDRVCLWDLATGSRLVTVSGIRNTVRALAFTPDGSALAGGGDDRVVRVWDVRGAERAQLIGHRGSVHALAYATGGRTLTSGGTDGSVRLWQPATGDELVRFEGLGGPVCYAAFSSDGRYLVCGVRDERDPRRLLVRRYDCGRAGDGGGTEPRP